MIRYNLLLGAALILCTQVVHAQAASAGSAAAWRQYLDLGQRLFSQRLYSAAEEALNASVKEAEAMKASDVPLGTSLRYLGMLYHVQRRYAEAQRTYQLAVAMLGINPAAAPREYAAALLHLADLHVLESRSSEAAQLFRQCAEVVETHIGPHDKMLIDPLQGSARLALSEGDYREALLLAQKALAVVRSQPEPSLPQVVETVEIIGAAYSQPGTYAMAEAVLENLTGLAGKAYGTNSPQTRRIIGRLAAVYRERLQFAEAEALMRQRLAATAGDPSDSLATTLNNLAEYLLAQQSFEEAEALLLRSAQIRRSSPGAEGPELAVTLYNLASLYADQGRTEEARNALSDAARICEHSLPAEHVQTVMIRNLQRKLAVAPPQASR